MEPPALQLDAAIHHDGGRRNDTVADLAAADAHRCAKLRIRRSECAGEERQRGEQRVPDAHTDVTTEAVP